LIFLRIGLKFEELVRIGSDNAAAESPRSIADYLRKRLAPNGMIYGAIR
jgi:hypothetical protein